MATEEAKELSLGASAGFYRVEPSGWWDFSRDVSVAFKASEYGGFNMF